MTRTRAIPTHYLHHQFFREEAECWCLVWRRLAEHTPTDLRAVAPGDRCTFAAASRPSVGILVTRRFSR